MVLPEPRGLASTTRHTITAPAASSSTMRTITVRARPACAIDKGEFFIFTSQFAFVSVLRRRLRRAKLFSAAYEKDAMWAAISSRVSGVNSQVRPQPFERFPAVRISGDLPDNALRAEPRLPIVRRPADHAAHQRADGVVFGAHDLLHHTVEGGRGLRQLVRHQPHGPGRPVLAIDLLQQAEHERVQFGFGRAARAGPD